MPALLDGRRQQFDELEREGAREAVLARAGTEDRGGHDTVVAVPDEKRECRGAAHDAGGDYRAAAAEGVVPVVSGSGLSPHRDRFAVLVPEHIPQPPRRSRLPSTTWLSTERATRETSRERSGLPGSGPA